MVIFLDRCVTGSKIVNFTEKLLIMADNYLEKRYDEYVARKEAEQKARQRAWKKRAWMLIGGNCLRRVRTSPVNKVQMSCVREAE